MIIRQKIRGKRKYYYLEHSIRKNSRIIEKELEEISIAFTYNTNAIEGSTITLEETREIIQENLAPNKPIRDIKETENHSKIFLQMLKDKKKVTKELLL